MPWVEATALLKEKKNEWERERKEKQKHECLFLFVLIQGLKMELWGLVGIWGESQAISFTRAEILGGAGDSEGLTLASPSLLPRETLPQDKANIKTRLF